MIAYFHFIRRGPHGKRRLQFLVAAGGYTDSPFIRHGPHRKRRMCIRCRNVFTEPLASNMHIQTHRLMGDIYEVRRSDGLRCHDIHTKFYQDWFSHSKVDKGGFTDTQTAWCISLLLFFQHKESGLKILPSFKHQHTDNIIVLIYMHLVQAKRFILERF
jgi:hypothetical protein